MTFEVDLPRIERAVTEILEAIGEDVSRDGIRETPARVVIAAVERAGARPSGNRRRPAGGADTVKETRSNIKKAKEDEEKKSAHLLIIMIFLFFSLFF